MASPRDLNKRKRPNMGARVRGGLKEILGGNLILFRHFKECMVHSNSIVLHSLINYQKHHRCTGGPGWQAPLTYIKKREALNGGEIERGAERDFGRKTLFSKITNYFSVIL